MGKEAILAYLGELASDRPLLARARMSARVRLYEETGGNPLLLRWVVGQLGRGSCSTIARAVTFLKNAPADNDPLDFVFAEHVKTLAPSALKVITALSELAHAVNSKEVAKRAKLSSIAAYTLLNDLADRGLAESDPARELFGVLPVVVSYLQRFLRRTP
jgi:hypothetical protein